MRDAALGLAGSSLRFAVVQYYRPRGRNVIRWRTRPDGRKGDVMPAGAEYRGIQTRVLAAENVHRVSGVIERLQGRSTHLDAHPHGSDGGLGREIVPILVFKGRNLRPALGRVARFPAVPTADDERETRSELICAPPQRPQVIFVLSVVYPYAKVSVLFSDGRRPEGIDIDIVSRRWRRRRGFWLGFLFKRNFRSPQGAVV
mmetsp:Transcript_18545/g.53470  ORF Transcript_18545/g.53470 Transcript_18545/m.53470 type:complete len:201 (+) Transcript_18545:185-787(+)